MRGDPALQVELLARWGLGTHSVSKSGDRLTSRVQKSTLRGLAAPGAEEDEEGAVDEEEDIFELEGQTEQLHLDARAGDAGGAHSERLAGRSGWEGAATGVCKPACKPGLAMWPALWRG